MTSKMQPMTMGISNQRRPGKIGFGFLVMFIIGEAISLFVKGNHKTRVFLQVFVPVAPRLNGRSAAN